MEYDMDYYPDCDKSWLGGDKLIGECSWMAIVYLLCRPPTCPEFPENPEIFAVSLNFLKNEKMS
jgi:hypothetical protein